MNSRAVLFQHRAARIFGRTARNAAGRGEVSKIEVTESYKYVVHVRCLGAVAILLFSALVAAEELIGTVVSVADGDTITVLDARRQQHRIRLAGIDAPEKGQPYGQVSKQHLAELIFQQNVTVDWHKRDKYRRIVGKVLLGNKDVCLEQLGAGLAWHYKKYESEQSPEDRQVYAEAEASARAGRVGLWRDKGAIPPWEWRHRER